MAAVTAARRRSLFYEELSHERERLLGQLADDRVVLGNLETFQEAHPDHWDELDEESLQKAVTRRKEADALFTRIEVARRVQRTRAIRRRNQTGGTR